MGLDFRVRYKASSMPKRDLSEKDFGLEGRQLGGVAGIDIMSI